MDTVVQYFCQFGLSGVKRQPVSQIVALPSQVGAATKVAHFYCTKQPRYGVNRACL